MTMYELSDTTVTTMLAKAAGSGVTVRVILDQNNEKANNTTAYNTLTTGKVAVHWANPTYKCTHQKTITVDGATSAIMTLNLTPEDYSTTRDFAVITNDAADVAAIEATFNADFTDTTITAPTGDNLVWSPPTPAPHCSRSSTAQPKLCSSRRRNSTTPASSPRSKRLSSAASPSPLSKRISTAPTPQSSTPSKPPVRK